jgi:hypothetical protein
MAGLRKKTPKNSATRVRQHRERMKKRGLKPVTIWLPDVNDPAYIAECRRQSLLTRADPHEADIMAWIEAIQSEDGFFGPPYDWGPDGPPPGSLPGEGKPGTPPKPR